MGEEQDKVRAQFQQAFGLFDKDGDGTITAKQLGVVMRSLGQNPTQAQLIDMIDQVDQDGSGQIQFDQFFTLMNSKMKSQNTQDQIQQVFNDFIRTKKGFFGASQIKHFMKTVGQDLTDEEVRQIMRQTDWDRDGKISFEDFMRMMLTK